MVRLSSRALSTKTRREPSGAIFDDVRSHRYLLWRSWDESLPVVSFVMLNPSAADEHANDPTIRRSINMAKDSGFGRLYVVNLFAYMTESPAVLKKSKPPAFDKENDHYIKLALDQSDKVLLAWGNHGAFQQQHKVVLQLLQAQGKVDDCFVFDVTKEGQPRHPLYTPKNISWRPAPLHLWS